MQTDQIAEDVAERDDKVPRAQFADIDETLKVDVNEFLFKRLPDTMTLRAFENLACAIDAAIRRAWDAE